MTDLPIIAAGVVGFLAGFVAAVCLLADEVSRLLWLQPSEKPHPAALDALPEARRPEKGSLPC